MLYVCTTRMKIQFRAQTQRYFILYSFFSNIFYFCNMCCVKDFVNFETPKRMYDCESLNILFTFTYRMRRDCVFFSEMGKNTYRFGPPFTTKSTFFFIIKLWLYVIYFLHSLVISLSLILSIIFRQCQGQSQIDSTKVSRHFFKATECKRLSLAIFHFTGVILCQQSFHLSENWNAISPYLTEISRYTLRNKISGCSQIITISVIYFIRTL